MTTASPGDIKALADLSPIPMLLLTVHGEVRYVNPAAEMLLDRIPMLSTATGTLAARRKPEDRELREALASLSATQPSSVVCLRTRESLPILIVDFYLLESGHAACRLTETASRPAPSPERLKRLFGLTRAEARVAVSMLSGLGIRAVARVCGVEAETVRTQAKRIRAKTGARTQNQLLGILWASGPELGASVTAMLAPPVAAPAAPVAHGKGLAG